MFTLTEDYLNWLNCFVIKNQQISVLSWKEALLLINEWNYYNYSDDYLIIDLDKYIPKEMMKFVFEKEVNNSSSWLIFWIIWSIFIWILLLIWWYYFFTKDVWQDIKSVNNTVSSKVSSITESFVKSDPVILNKDSWNISTIKNKKDDNLTNNNIIKDDLVIQKQLDDCNSYNTKILMDFEDYKYKTDFLRDENIELIKNIDDIKIENNLLISNNKDLNIKISELERSVSWSITPLEDYLGIKLFEKCKNDPRLNCNNLFYYFYDKN